MRSLEAFRHVFETGSVTRAAELLGVSQPAISQTIFALEKAIGAKLFERSGARRLAPTPEARLVYPACCGVLESLERFELASRDARSGGRVTIGAVPTMAMGFAQDAIDRLRADFPSIHVNLDPRYPANLEGLLVSGALDIAISTAQGGSDKVETDQIATVPMVVVVPNDHRLAGQSSISPEDLDGESLAVLHRTSSYRPALDAVFNAAGRPLMPAVEAPGFTLSDFVKRGQAIGIMSAISAWRIHEDDVAIIPLAPTIECAVFMLRRRGVELHPFCAAFRDEIARFLAEISAALPGPRPAKAPARRRSRAG